MYRSFSPTTVRPNLPLRKPSSSPMSPSTTASAPRFSMQHASPVRPSAGPLGDGLLRPSAIMSTSTLLRGFMPPAPTVCFCNFCGQQGKFRCKRCKNTPYCSVECQTEDWKAHRRICKPIDSEPVKEEQKENEASPVTESAVGLLESQHGDTPNLQRVFLKDLHVTKIIKGTEIQASVVEYYSPGRFFVLAQSPELLEALQTISSELQNTYSFPSVTTYIPCVGEVCAVQFSSDMNWYRGLVQSLAADQKKANILYIDFGNEEDVPVERIKALAANIKPFCPCAMECRVARVISASDTWPSECCMAGKTLLAGQTVIVKLVDTLENGRIHAVDILLSTGKQLSTILLEQGYAVEETGNVAPTEQEISAMVTASLENFKRKSSGKDDNTWAQPPEPLTQAMGDSFSVVVTHIQSPNEIIVQKVDNAAVIQQLQMQLREHCSQIPTPQNFRPAPDTVCCAQFSEDKQWYRAKVLAYPSEESVCVGYLDFGNSEEVNLGHLRPINSSLLSLPMQAIPCGLTGVQPVEETWSQNCLLALQRRISNRILRIEIQGANEGKALVAMIDEASDPQANIAELLTSAGFAAPAPVNNSSDQQGDQTTSAVEEPQVPTPPSEPLKWSRIELPCDGQMVALLACVVENPGVFYCHINNPADRQRLIELKAELKQHCEAAETSFVPKVGEPCCVLFPGDEAWYRGMVNELSVNKVSVNFVDYGYSMQVEKHQLRSITPRLLELPFQAIQCWLADVEPLGSEWSSEALLWFQSLVDSEPLSARALSVTERGYGLELESRGQNVAAALISEQLAKAPGVLPKEAHKAIDGSAKLQEKKEESENSQIQTQPSNLSGAKDTLTERQNKTPSEVPSFPVDWKTVELPRNETFQPFFAAFRSPSLFYLLGPNPVDQQKLQEVMMEVAIYCKNCPASLSSTVLSSLAQGAACCAQFSADNNWYRAVVIDIGENDVNVIYADYGNAEKVPFSRILPITSHLLQLPFLITRCTLAGKEHFPAEWPGETLHMLQGLLSDSILATVQSFDGSANVLLLTLPTERGGENVTTMVLDALQAQAKRNLSPSSVPKADQMDSSTSAVINPVMSDSPQPKSSPEITTAQTGSIIMAESMARSNQQKKATPAGNEDLVQRIIGQMEPPCQISAQTKDPPTSGCCCQSLKTKIDHLEQLLQQQISFMEKFVGQTK